MTYVAPDLCSRKMGVFFFRLERVLRMHEGVDDVMVMDIEYSWDGGLSALKMVKVEKLML